MSKGRGVFRHSLSPSGESGFECLQRVACSLVVFLILTLLYFPYVTLRRDEPVCLLIPPYVFARFV